MSLKAAIRAGVQERAKQDNQAIKEENNHDSKIGNNLDSKLENELEAAPDELVGLNIRVPKSHRLHWLIASKREGSSLTAAVNEALAARYGLPTDQE